MFESFLVKEEAKGGVLTVNIPLLSSRDYYLEDKAEETEELKKELANMIVGAK